MLNVNIGDIRTVELNGEAIQVRVLKIVDSGMFRVAPLGNSGDWLAARVEGDAFVLIDSPQPVNNSEADRAALNPVPASGVEGKQWWKNKKKK